MSFPRCYILRRLFRESLTQPYPSRDSVTTRLPDQRTQTMQEKETTFN